MLTLEILVPFVKKANNEQKVFFFKNICLCIYFGCTGSLLLLGLFSSCEGLLSSCGVWMGLSLWSFLCYKAQAVSTWASVVVAHGLSCPAACGIFPNQWSNPCLRHWYADSLPLRHQGSPTKGFIASYSPQFNFKAKPTFEGGGGSKYIAFPAGKESACNVGDPGSIPGSGRSPGEGNGNPLQYSGLENPTDRGAWWATVHRVTKSWMQLSDLHPLFGMEVNGREGSWQWGWVIANHRESITINAIDPRKSSSRQEGLEAHLGLQLLPHGRQTFTST